MAHLWNAVYKYRHTVSAEYCHKPVPTQSSDTPTEAQSR